MESEKRETEETNPDEPTDNGEPPSEAYEPQRDDPIPDESADDRQQKATDDGMTQGTQRRP